MQPSDSGTAKSQAILGGCRQQITTMEWDTGVVPFPAHPILIFAALSPAVEAFPYGKTPVTLNSINVDALTIEC